MIANVDSLDCPNSLDLKKMHLNTSLQTQEGDISIQATGRLRGEPRQENRR